MAFPDTLEKLIEDGVIDSVKSRLMSGKEAAVFVVERQGELLAAKVYKAREQRTFKATSSYTEGRNQTRNSRDKRAMGKRSSYGKELMEESWRDVEVRALSEAFHAGVRVPKPFMLHDDVLLMELLVDEEGSPAPRLADFELAREVAERLHKEIYEQVRLLLSCGKIHGDLSAFNILMARGGPTLIDMPQIVDAARNNQAREILRRDLRNVTEHLARFDARLLRFRDCGDALWMHYVNGTLEAATEPQEGGVGGGHHRSRRSRDAERGRMGRERPDHVPARFDGPPSPGPADQGAPRPFSPGQGPPRPGPPPRQGPPPPRQGPPPGAPSQGSSRWDGPPRAPQGPPRDGRQGPPRDGPPRHGAPGQGPDGPPRAPGQGPPRDGRQGPPRDGPPRHGAPGQGADGPPRAPGQGPPRDGPWRQGPPRDGPPRHGAPGQGADGPPRAPGQGPPRDGPWRQGPPRDGPPRHGAPGQGPPHDGPPRSGGAGYGPPRDGPPRDGRPVGAGYGPSRDEPSRDGPPRDGRPGGSGYGPPRDGPPRPARDASPGEGPHRWGPPRPPRGGQER